ncbi:TPA: hypothetical protein L4S95_004796 [Pseudomonas aeruginosa]|uniref:hypothetical protein n=1 Tax=Pseudomonas aeruginosa TaxID=287 RepID=UPI000E3204D6|nr:hypothetical protein [Pseudomonas aeruginosa]WAJ86468.1 hypothetical protein PAC13_08400 [Pseudomonas aeruginosa]HBO1538481.1 hypothetical protein [Pseudomonas aeruginosa]HBO1577989.1 hypothetical protein [Pseudomonas aeruginosa]HBO3753248.1 hypothetical protein [Pseudomonas aeruginosa]HCE6619163.1 hypothetical protein [Pseudomonas aeruginosa]
MTESKICTCPSGDGSLRWPCPAHPAEQAGGDERVIGWRERILAAHPNSDPGFWPDALLVEHMAAEIADLRAALAQPSPALPPFAEKVLAKLRRFYDCAEDFESGGVDIGRHWLDLLTQLGLLNRVQRSPALWEISQQGEDLLGLDVSEIEVPDSMIEKAWQRFERALQQLETPEQAEQAEQAGQRELLRSVTAERDAALARVAKMEACGAPALLAAADYFAERAKGPSPGWVTLSAVAKELRVRADKATAAQAQHSVPEEFIGRLSEFLAQRGTTGKALLRELRAMLAAAPVCRLSRSALTDAQMRRLYDSSTETENERLGFAAFARLIRRAEAVHQIAAAPGKEVGHE